MPRVRKGAKAKAAAATAAAAKVVAKEEKLRGAQHRASAPNLSSGDQETGPIETVHISATGETSATREPIEVVTGTDFVRRIETEAFMNELVEVVVEQSGKEGAPLFVHAGHNGTDQYLIRDQPQMIKRKFLYSLLQAREKKGTCEFGQDSSSKKEYNRLTFNATLTHSVRVLSDANPNGAEWMRQQLKAA